ncbi:unnamed protein product [Brachionus calyciflorus]|uniref:NSUN5 n=1 Tax=Brachionus calyciflorus TaxID=104777 RepID=A0A814E3F5_9BILA|nr:unnamed protein product [Brachionus calyciflorus]
MADLVVWRPEFFGTKPEMIIKGGQIVSSSNKKSVVLDKDAQLLGTCGKSPCANSVLFISKASYEIGATNTYGICKHVEPIRDCRSLNRTQHMYPINFSPRIAYSSSTAKNILNYTEPETNQSKQLLPIKEDIKNQGSIQSLIGQSNCQHKNSLTCLIMKTLSYKKLLDKIIKRSKMLEKEKFLGDKLAQLLVYDVLFGMGVRGKFKSAIKRNYDNLVEACDYYMNRYQVDKRDDLLKIFDEKQAAHTSTKPKYIFINQLILKKKEILQKLMDDSFEMVEYDRKSESYRKTNDQFKELIDSLGNNQFIRDNHVKNLIIFKHDASINKNYSLFNEGHFLQIDKSSCLVPLALDPEPESHVIDGASAPGNKTILLANILKNTGLIHAFDIDEKRVKLMQSNIKQHHVTNVRLKCMDFLQTEYLKYDRVSHIMLDVPCSGSGMTNRLKFGDTELENTKDENRLWKLEALQRRMLVHAMSFPNVKKIVYSTCSIHPEEDENVVRYALKNCDDRFKLVNLFPDKWSYGRGICLDDVDKNELHLDYCIRTSFESNYTNGFFIASFELNQNDDLNQEMETSQNFE